MLAIKLIGGEFKKKGKERKKKKHDFTVAANSVHALCEGGTCCGNKARAS